LDKRCGNSYMDGSWRKLCIDVGKEVEVVAKIGVA